MFREDGGRPNDRRGFLHKSFIGRAVGKVAKRVFSATPVGAAVTTGLEIAGSIVKRPARAVASRTTTARPSLAGAQGKEFGRDLKFPGLAPPSLSFSGGPSSRGPFGIPGGGGGRSPCRPRETALCCQLRNGNTDQQARWQFECAGAAQPGGAMGVGEAVMGQFGAALEPGMMTIERSVCLPGMQLAKDGLCYNKGAITNSQRMWPRGRRPLLTGGDMRAIGIAARAGSKLDRTTKRLRALGMMKALPKGRGGAAHAHARPVAAVSVPS